MLVHDDRRDCDANCSTENTGLGYCSLRDGYLMSVEVLIEREWKSEDNLQ